jgi:hypothetical protein
MIDVMNSFDDATTTESSEPTDDKLVFLNGKEQLKFLRGKREYRGKKNKLRLVIQSIRAKFIQILISRISSIGHYDERIRICTLIKDLT